MRDLYQALQVPRKSNIMVSHEDTLHFVGFEITDENTIQSYVNFFSYRKGTMANTASKVIMISRKTYHPFFKYVEHWARTFQNNHNLRFAFVFWNRTLDPLHLKLAKSEIKCIVPMNLQIIEKLYDEYRSSSELNIYDIIPGLMSFLDKKNDSITATDSIYRSYLWNGGLETVSAIIKRLSTLTKFIDKDMDDELEAIIEKLKTCIVPATINGFDWYEFDNMKMKKYLMPYLMTMQNKLQIKAQNIYERNVKSHATNIN